MHTGQRLVSICAAAVLSLAAATLSPLTQAQTVTATLHGQILDPVATAVNPATNKIYVVGTDSVAVIDGASNAIDLLVAHSHPSAVAVNPVTNRIYVTKTFSSNVMVIDGASDNTTDVALGTFPLAIAVNPVTNRIYVTNENSSIISVINGADNSVTTVDIGAIPTAIALNPVTSKIYVATAANNVKVIDPANNNAIATVTTDTNPGAVAVNSLTNKIYVANSGAATVTVINGADNTITRVAAGNNPTAVALNAVTNKIYVANSGGNSVTVIDGATNTPATVSDPNATSPAAIAVNPLANKIFVANRGSGNVTVINGADNTTITLNVGPTPLAVGVNPVTNKIYVANNGTHSFVLDSSETVIDGATNTTTTVAAGTAPAAVAVNPVTNKIYVANGISANVTVIDGATNAPSTVAAGTTPFDVAANPVTNKIYVANADSANVTVIDGATNAPSTVAAGTTPLAVAVNPVTNKIYVANYDSDNVTVIDGATNTTTTVGAGTAPNAVAVNPVTNKIYVANFLSNDVTVIDGATNATTTIGVGFNPFAVALNPVTNKIYVANNGSNNVTVIDGLTNAASTVGAGSLPIDVTANPVTNKIYVANQNSNNVTVIDGATNTTTTIGAGTTPFAVRVNPVTNKIYVANQNSNNVTVIDGVSNATTTVGAGAKPQAIAVNPVTNRIYVANFGSDNVTVITEQQVQFIPLTTSISPLPNNTFTNPGALTFHFTTSSAYAPIAPPVQNVYFQLDTWQGPWLQATGTAPNFSGGPAAPLLPGIHIVYAYATDSQFADSIQPGAQTQSGPLPGAIAAYVFLVLASPSTVSLTSGTNPSTYGQTLTFTATVAASGATPTGIVQFFDGNTLLGIATLNGSAQAAFAITPLAGTHPITATYLGDANFAGSTSPVLNQLVNRATSHILVVLAGSPNPSIYGQGLTFVGDVTPKFSFLVPDASGTVTFYDGSTPLGTCTLSGTGVLCQTTTTAVPAGTHSITAVYAGDTNFTGSTSDPITQTVTPASSSVAVALTMGANPSVVGQPLTFTATVSPQFGGVPTGQVIFKDGSNVIGTQSLNSGGKAAITTAYLGIGAHSITAFYAGDQNFMSSDSSGSPLSQTVNTSAGTALTNLVLTTTPATISPNTSLFRKAVTLTATATPNTATGKIIFIDGTTLLGSATLNGSGVASITIQPGLGAHIITFCYSGDTNFSPAIASRVLYHSPRPH